MRGRMLTCGSGVPGLCRRRGDFSRFCQSCSSKTSRNRRSSRAGSEPSASAAIAPSKAQRVGLGQWPFDVNGDSGIARPAQGGDRITGSSADRIHSISSARLSSGLARRASKNSARRESGTATRGPGTRVACGDCRPRDRRLVQGSQDEPPRAARRSCHRTGAAVPAVDAHSKAATLSRGSEGCESPRPDVWASVTAVGRSSGSATAAQPDGAARWRSRPCAQEARSTGLDS